MNCLLCFGVAKLFFKDSRSFAEYFHCPECDLIFLDPAKRLNAQQERSRYELHEFGNMGYQDFVAPMLEWVQTHCKPGSRGLDFGCGNIPVFTQFLIEQGYQVASYDPFFHPDTSCLDELYDFVIAIEVAEHFYNPATEFARLRKLLKPGAGLGVMTALYHPGIDFASWHYRRDPTHVCFYSANTFEWIKQKFDFSFYQQSDGRVNWLST